MCVPLTPCVSSASDGCSVSSRCRLGPDGVADGGSDPGGLRRESTAPGGVTTQVPEQDPSDRTGPTLGLGRWMSCGTRNQRSRHFTVLTVSSLPRPFFLYSTVHCP